MLVVSSQLVHRKPTLISAVIFADIRTAMKNRNKPAAMECAKGVCSGTRGQTHVCAGYD